MRFPFFRPATDKFPYPTTYDILKSLAVILMIIDHIGLYLDTGNQWWRAVGRICVPIWFYLIGYAHSRKISPKLLGGGSTLLFYDLLFGFVILPFNVLWSISFIRLVLNKITKIIGHSESILFILMLVFLLVDPFLNFLWEYGGIAFILALAGYYQRHGFGEKKLVPNAVALFATFAFIYIQQNEFNFHLMPFMIMGCGTVLIMLALVFYLPRQGPALTTNNRLVTVPLMIGGRYTLEIYVGHLLVLKLIYFTLFGCSGSICLLH